MEGRMGEGQNHKERRGKERVEWGRGPWRAVLAFLPCRGPRVPSYATDSMSRPVVATSTTGFKEDKLQKLGLFLMSQGNSTTSRYSANTSLEQRISHLSTLVGLSN